MTFDVTGRAPVLLSLPAWTPGAYEISWLRPLGLRLRGHAAAARPLEWDKLDYDTWRIRPRGGRADPGRLQVSWPTTLDNAMAWAGRDFLLFNGTNVFLYPEGRRLSTFPPR